MSTQPYPATFSVEYPDRSLNRLSTFFRLIVAIPILLLLGALSGEYGSWSDEGGLNAIGAGGLLICATAAMIVIRQKYPRWWFDWNLELQRFINRVVAYLALMDDRYPSTDEHQSVHLDIRYPDAKSDLNRFMPLVKWFLAIPHFVVLTFLNLGAALVIFFAWVCILVTGRYPRSLFEYVEGVMRWDNRVIAYTFILATDQYPPFSLE